MTRSGKAALAGCRVLVTRTQGRAQGLVDALHAAGAEVVVVPLLSTVPLTSPAEVDEAMRRLRSSPAPHWIAFTSATAVRLIAGVLDPPNTEVRTAAVGQATAAALTAARWRVDAMSQGGQDAKSLAAELTRRRISGGTVLFPAAADAHRTLPDLLSAAGATVLELPLYRTEMPTDAPRRLAAALDGGVDAVMLASGSAARNLVSALEGRGGELRGRDGPPRVICIGPQTAADAEAAGLRVDSTALLPTPEAMVAALVAGVARRESVR